MLAQWLEINNFDDLGVLNFEDLGFSQTSKT